MIENGRPTFFYNNKKKNSENKIRAAGIIFYYYENNQPIFLMINVSGKYEDFGGKTDVIDTSILETIVREATEESNNIFNKNNIKICKKNMCYSKKSKYLLCFQEISIKYDVELFGTVELNNGINRTVEWIKLDLLLDPLFIKNKLHARLRFGYFFKKLKLLHNHDLFID